LEAIHEGKSCLLSGGAPDSPVPDFLPEMEQSTVAVLEPLAHRTVRCLHLTVGSATRHARIARPTVGPADRWLTGQSGAPPDSPVNYSRTTPDFSRERHVHRSSAWRTGHCPVHHRTVRCARLSSDFVYTSKPFSFLFFSSSFCF
jgi:hypothetical protein